MAEDESQKERVDRELIELLNELRVVLPGVQVLFAFLLILPFQVGFERATDSERLVYFVALVSSATAGVLLIAPSVYHRINFRRKVKEQMLFDANRMLIASTFFIAIGIVCSLYVITELLFGVVAGLVMVAISVTIFGVLWYAFPLHRRGEPDESLEPEADTDA